MDFGGEIKISEGEEVDGTAILPGGGLEARDDAVTVEEEEFDAVVLVAVEASTWGNINM